MNVLRQSMSKVIMTVLAVMLLGVVLAFSSARVAWLAQAEHFAAQDLLQLQSQWVVSVHGAQRQFLSFTVSGKLADLQQYESYSQDANKQIELLLSRLDSTYQQGWVSMLQTNWTRQRASMDQTIAAVRSAQISAPDLKTRIAADQDLMTENDQLIRQLSRSFEIQAAQAHASETANLQTALWIIAFTLIGALLGVFYLRWSIKARVTNALRTLVSHVEEMEYGLQRVDEPFADPDVDALRLAFNTLHARLSLHQSQLEFSSKRELENAKKMLKEQEDFSSVLAHELRTPLSTLIGTIENEAFSRNWPRDEVHDRVKSITRLMLELVNSTLDYRRIKQGRYTLQSDRFRAEEFIQSVQDKLVGIPNSAHHQFIIDNQVPKQVWLRGDLTKIKQIIFNLLGNAFKFTPTGGTITLQCRLLQNDGAANLILAVKDTGIGIAEEGLDNIFLPFTQADSGISRKYGGTGIGLALCWEIANCLGGELSVVSELGQGSEFTLIVPVALSDQAPLERQSADPSDVRLDDWHVLMVEDHPLNAKISIALLERGFGCEISHAISGEEAIERLARGDLYDLILMDINLGNGMSGLETTRLLIEKYGDQCPPVVALTAGILDEDKFKVFEAGMKGFLGKPFTMASAKQVLGSLKLERQNAVKSCRISSISDISMPHSTSESMDPFEF